MQNKRKIYIHSSLGLCFGLDLQTGGDKRNDSELHAGKHSLYIIRSYVFVNVNLICYCTSKMCCIFRGFIVYAASLHGLHFQIPFLGVYFNLFQIQIYCYII
jgi:hypothetical protein